MAKAKAEPKEKKTYSQTTVNKYKNEIAKLEDKNKVLMKQKREMTPKGKKKGLSGIGAMTGDSFSGVISTLVTTIIAGIASNILRKVFDFILDLVSAGKIKDIPFYTVISRLLVMISYYLGASYIIRDKETSNDVITGAIVVQGYEIANELIKEFQKPGKDVKGLGYIGQNANYATIEQTRAILNEMLTRQPASMDYNSKLQNAIMQTQAYLMANHGLNANPGGLSGMGLTDDEINAIFEGLGGFGNVNMQKFLMDGVAQNSIDEEEIKDFVNSISEVIVKSNDTYDNADTQGENAYGINEVAQNQENEKPVTIVNEDLLEVQLLKGISETAVQEITQNKDELIESMYIGL